MGRRGLALGCEVEGFGRGAIKRPPLRTTTAGEVTLLQVWGLRFGVWRSWFVVCGLKIGVWSLGFGVEGSGLRVWGLRFEV